MEESQWPSSGENANETLEGACQRFAELDATAVQKQARFRRVEAALRADLDLRELNADEGAVFNAEIAAAVQENLAESHYGTLLAERGVTTVALDDNGEIVEHRPDGSSVALSTKRDAARRKRASAKPTR